MNILMIVDLIVVLLLTITIVCAVYMHKKFNALYNNQEKMHKFMQDFTICMQQADDSIKELSSASDAILTNLHDNIKQASDLKDDLNLLNAKGEEIAGKLDGSISKIRKLQQDLDQHLQPKSAKVQDISVKISEKNNVNFTQSDELQPELMRNLKNMR